MGTPDHAREPCPDRMILVGRLVWVQLGDLHGISLGNEKFASWGEAVGWNSGCEDKRAENRWEFRCMGWIVLHVRLFDGLSKAKRGSLEFDLGRCGYWWISSTQGWC
ncbi:hypothetical protein R1flu_028650 [Riccia fluitans]|uniref:Uncharacterized protein n=1 Tax=Riccia fluitans TaxID=41844 RepID=A0ABD1XMD1_9MARC